MSTSAITHIAYIVRMDGVFAYRGRSLPEVEAHALAAKAQDTTLAWFIYEYRGSHLELVSQGAK